MKKILLATLFALLPLTSGAVDLPAYPFIHVNGYGAAVVIPDIGTVEFEIAAQDGDPAVALATVQARIDDIRAVMQQLGVAEADLEMRDIRRDIRRDIQKTDQPGAPLYELRCSVKLTVRNLSNWKMLVQPLLDKPNLDGFMTGFDSSEREKIEIGLMGDAIRMARRKAEGVAAGLGRKLGAVSAVSTGELKNLTRAMNLSPSEFNNYRGNQERRAPADRAELVTVTSLKLQQPVDVIFRIQ
ncbi:SIMPL domain-containing protein [Massilia sp. TSP1-1-2]|uniref:SIMPL domain-containing protein n=1 Tax=Massilia sp. TSP1-1-2 TaxID=2804649 RepID=UPI003CF50DD7